MLRHHQDKAIQDCLIFLINLIKFGGNSPSIKILLFSFSAKFGHSQEKFTFIWHFSSYLFFFFFFEKQQCKHKIIKFLLFYSFIIFFLNKNFPTIRHTTWSMTYEIWHLFIIKDVPIGTHGLFTHKTRRKWKSTI